ncbi:hypothetical protein ACOZ38_44380 [Sphaerisporangium viridialbum]|uniref:hypothetical protein n=1 Tax=Sphaerisporangium viridialbum TaxID=46189 RepID=UPI003C781D04
MADLAFIEVDALLFATAKSAPDNVVGLIYSVRTLLRSARPARRWNYGNDVRGKLEELSENVADAKSHEAINDCIACLEGAMDATTLQRKWGTRYLRIDDEHTFEVKIFGGGSRLSEEDKQRLLEHLNAQEPLQIIIRGHLWVELMINDVLQEVLPRPEHLQKARLSFSQRIHLAAAMQLISSEDLPSMLKLNRIRNTAAHELNSTIDAVAVQELISTLSPKMRFIAFNGRPVDEFPSDLRTIIATMVVMLDGVRDGLVASRRASLFWHEEAKRVLGRTD